MIRSDHAAPNPPLPLRAWLAWRRGGAGYVWHKAMRRTLGRWPDWKRTLVYTDPREYWTLRGGHDYFREQEGQPDRCRRSSWLAERVGSYRPGSVLEVGCGYGKQLRALRLRLDAPLVGVDFSPSQLAAARGYLGGLDGIGLALADGGRLPFPDDSFDLVLTSAVILHNAPAVAEQIRREVLRVARRWAAHNEDTDRTYNRLRLRHGRLVSRPRPPAGRGRADPGRPARGGRPLAVLRRRAEPPRSTRDPRPDDRDCRPRPATAPPPPRAEGRRAVRDSLIVTVGGQLERALGTLTALAMKWGLDPAEHGIYSGLRLWLDHANRASLGVGRGAVQEIPVLRAAGREDEAERVADVAFAACIAGRPALRRRPCWRSPGGDGRPAAGDPTAAAWAVGLVAVAALVLIKRYQDFLIALHRAHQPVRPDDRAGDRRRRGLRGRWWPSGSGWRGSGGSWRRSAC